MINFYFPPIPNKRYIYIVYTQNMSTTLIKQALCRDPSDYEGLLATLSIVRTLLECDKDGLVVDGAATDILKKLFNSVDEFTDQQCCDELEPLSPYDMWYDPDHPENSCFKELCIYFNVKSCYPAVCPWRIVCDECIENALGISGCPSDMDYCEDACFSKIAMCLAAWLGLISDAIKQCQDQAAMDPHHAIDPNNPNCITLEEALKVLDALCNIVKQKAAAIRTLRKASLTINYCDF